MRSHNLSASQLRRQSLGADLPTATSHRCIACPTELLAFTRLPRVAVFAAAAARQAQRVGAAAASHPDLGPQWLRRGLLAVAAFGAWQSAAGQSLTAPAATPETITVRGVVFDDSLNVPIPGLWLYLNGTKYGAITDAQGEFAFSFPTGWKPVRGGTLSIRATPVPYTFKEMRVPLDWRTYDSAKPLTLRLASAPGRGRPNLHGYNWMAPPVPPPMYPPRAHTSRP